MSAVDKVSFSKLRSAFFTGLIVLLSVAILYLIRPFFYPIFWAAVIAIVFYPHYNWLNSFIRMPGLNALLMVCVVLVTIFLPLTLISALLVNESVDLYGKVSEKGFAENIEGVSTWLEGTPLAPYIDTVKTDWTRYAADATKRLSGYFFSGIKSVTQNSLRFFFMLFIMFYTLFYFFKDGHRMLDRLKHLSPVGEKYEVMLYDRFTSTVRATLKSTFIVGGIQGIIGGILFWITGVPGALIWGVIMIALSIVPALGSFVVWLPAGLIMLALGNTWQGVTILLVGTFVISTIDNLLRPPLVGRDIQMHPLLGLFSTLGGIVLFGISGFIIGPIIAALYLSIMTIYDHYYKSELESN